MGWLRNGCCLGLTSVLVAVAAEAFTGKPLVEAGRLLASVLAEYSLQTLSLISSFLELPYRAFYAVLVLGCVSLYYVFACLSEPLNIVYHPDGRRSKRDNANVVAKRKLVGEIPPVYPNGWFAVSESSELENGVSKSICALGLNLVVFRDYQGCVHILDAYCPHLGTNLGVGGRVVGDCIECPLHGWRFRGDDGKCTKIPTTDKIPDQAQLKAWPCMEVNGFVYLWYHAEGSEPTWSVPEIQNGKWTHRGRIEVYIKTHIKDIQENGVDQVHFAHLHKTSTMAGRDLLKGWNKPYSVHAHRYTYTSESIQHAKPAEHMVLVRFKAFQEFFGRRFAPFDIDIHSETIGPSIVHTRFDGRLGPFGLISFNVLPVGPLLQKVVHTFYCPWIMPTFIANIILKGFDIQFQRDIVIWNNKTFPVKPVLSKSPEDAFFVRNKRWFSQFYSEHSPTHAFQNDTLEW